MVYTRPIPYLPADARHQEGHAHQSNVRGHRRHERSDHKNSGHRLDLGRLHKNAFSRHSRPNENLHEKRIRSARFFMKSCLPRRIPLCSASVLPPLATLSPSSGTRKKDDSGLRNPLAGNISYVISQGSSQSGNFIRSFIHLGFNADEAGRIVWDGAMPHIAGRQEPLNLRFALPDGASDPYEPGSEAMLWWSDWTDTVRGRKSAGLLDRCNATHTCPKIMETFGSTEFWDLRMSPDLVGTSAAEDIPLPDNVRRYYFPGTTHGGGAGGFSSQFPARPVAAAGCANFRPIPIQNRIRCGR